MPFATEQRHTYPQSQQFAAPHSGHATMSGDAQPPPRAPTPNELVRPFRNKNAILGGALFAFTAAVYAYSMRSVKQEDFSNIAPNPSK